MLISIIANSNCYCMHYFLFTFWFLLGLSFLFIMVSLKNISCFTFYFYLFTLKICSHLQGEMISSAERRGFFNFALFIYVFIIELNNFLYKSLKAPEFCLKYVINLNFINIPINMKFEFYQYPNKYELICCEILSS